MKPFPKVQELCLNYHTKYLIFWNFHLQDKINQLKVSNDDLL